MLHRSSNYGWPLVSPCFRTRVKRDKMKNNICVATVACAAFVACGCCETRVEIDPSVFDGTWCYPPNVVGMPDYKVCLTGDDEYVELFQRVPVVERVSVPNGVCLMLQHKRPSSAEGIFQLVVLLRVDDDSIELREDGGAIQPLMRQRVPKASSKPVKQ